MNGYIKIDIGGKERGLKFNQFALEEISKHSENDSASAFIYAIFWGGLRGNNYVKREEVDYSFEEVCDWVDALPKESKQETMIAVNKCLSDTQLYRDLTETKVADVQTVEEKKNISMTA